MDKKEFGNKLRQARLDMGVSQTYVARQIKCKNGTISRAEIGCTIPDEIVLKALCDFYGIESLEEEARKLREIKGPRPKGSAPDGYARFFQEARLKNGQTQAEIAEKVGFSIARISHMELGKCPPTEGTLEKICQAYGVDVDEAREVIGERMRKDPSKYAKARAKKGLSQATAASLIGIPANALCKIERSNDAPPSIANIMADIYDAPELAKETTGYIGNASFRENLREFKGSYPVNLMIDVCGEDALYQLERKYDEFEAAMNDLPTREQSILYKRYKQHKSLEATGRDFGCTRERIRQIEHRALGRLKSRFSSETHDESSAYYELLDKYDKLKNEYENLKSACNEAFRTMDSEVDSLNLKKISIEGMALSVRATHCLLSAGMKTAYDVSKLSYADLLKIRNLGMKSTTEICRKMEALGSPIL